MLRVICGGKATVIIPGALHLPGCEVINSDVLKRCAQMATF